MSAMKQTLKPPIDRSPESAVASRAGHSVLDEFAAFFEWIRDSVRNVVLDIDKYLRTQKLAEQRGILA